MMAGCGGGGGNPTTALPTKIVNISMTEVELSSVNFPIDELTGAGVGGLANINGDLWYIRRSSPSALVKFTP